MICWFKQTRWTLVGIVLAGLSTDAGALDPNRLPSQYVRAQWTSESGFPGGAVAVVQAGPVGRTGKSGVLPTVAEARAGILPWRY